MFQKQFGERFLSEERKVIIHFLYSALQGLKCLTRTLVISIRKIIEKSRKGKINFFFFGGRRNSIVFKKKLKETLEEALM